jgi:hypothetical protein
VTDPPGRLESLVRSTPWLLEALRAARDVDPPDWLVGGGVLRDLVWDRLHGQSRPAPPRDVDLAFFDPTRLDRARDAEVEQALAARLPGVPWDAKNQAAVHTWYGRVFGGRVAPLRSAADGVATWPETATAVAVRLLPDDRLEVVAPAAWTTCSAWSAGATPAGSPSTTTTGGSTTSASPNGGRGSRSSWRAKMVP